MMPTIYEALMTLLKVIQARIETLPYLIAFTLTLVWILIFGTVVSALVGIGMMLPLLPLVWLMDFLGII
jgi:hypothetical protein